MAWIFSLSAECGPNKSAAEELALHFQDLVVTIRSGSRFPCHPHIYQYGADWWVVIVPEGVSRCGLHTEPEVQEATEIGFALYERLRTAPSYRYALVGVEVDDFRSFSELDDDVVHFSGLVLADAVWQHLGSPSDFVPFAPGYRWRPFVRAK